MITARTIQILDANNYNISPATCIDSLYFEYTNSAGQTDRASLRNRTLVAGDTIVLNTNIEKNFDSLSDVTIPYVYFTNVDGTSDTTGRIIQANADLVKIGDTLGAALKNDLKPYITEETANKRFLYTDNTNYAEDTIRVRDTGAITLSASSDTAGNISVVDTLSLSADKNKSATIKSLAELTVDSSVMSLKGSADSHIDINDTTVDIITKIASVTADSIQLSNTSLGGITISGYSSTQPVRIENRAVSTSTYIDVNPTSINLSAQKIRMYDADIPNPNGSEFNKDAALYLKAVYKSGALSEYTWAPTPTLTIETNDNVTDMYRIIILNTGNAKLYQSSIVAQGNTPTDGKRYTMLSNSGIDKDGLNMAEDIYIRSIKSGDSTSSLVCPVRTLVDPLAASSNALKLVTINNKSLITSKDEDDMSLLTMNDISAIKYVAYKKTSESTQQYKIFGAMASELLNLNNDRSKDKYDSPDATINYSDSVYYRGNGAMFAAGYYSTSDERMKTDIHLIDYENKPVLPEIKEFIWKDTSVRSYGFIAQEVEKYYPELVDEDMEGIKKIDQYGTLSLLCGMLRNENCMLRNRMEKLENRLAMVEKTCAKLKNKGILYS